jgi:hypothetical protein
MCLHKHFTQLYMFLISSYEKVRPQSTAKLSKKPSRDREDDIFYLSNALPYALMRSGYYGALRVFKLTRAAVRIMGYR